MSPQAPNYEQKQKVLLEKGINNETAFPLSLRDPVPEILLQTLRVQRMESNPTWCEGLGFKLSRIDILPVPVSADNERMVLESLLGGLVEMQTQYRTTMEEDKQLLKGELSNNIRHAVILRLSEKKILQMSLEEIRHKLKNVK
jgi:hypothetical protein